MAMLKIAWASYEINKYFNENMNKRNRQRRRERDREKYKERERESLYIYSQIIKNENLLTSTHVIDSPSNSTKI